MKNLMVAVVALASSATVMASDFRFDYTAKDLATPADVAALHVRLEREAGIFCQRRYDKRITEARACRATLVEDAVRQIDSPQLTARLDGGSQPTS